MVAPSQLQQQRQQRVPPPPVVVVAAATGQDSGVSTDFERKKEALKVGVPVVVVD